MSKYSQQSEKRKEAQRASSRNWRKAHPKETREHRDKWYAKNPIKKFFAQWKSRANHRGRPFDLKESDIVFPLVCPVLGIPMNYEDIKSDGYPHLDEIIPEKGYVSGNVKIISQRANRIKQDGSAEEHLKIAAYIQRETA